MAEVDTSKEPKKGLLKSYLDKTFGDEGLKTDVKITLTNETVVKFIASVAGAVILGTISFYMIKAMFVQK